MSEAYAHRVRHETVDSIIGETTPRQAMAHRAVDTASGWSSPIHDGYPFSGDELARQRAMGVLGPAVKRQPLATGYLGRRVLADGHVVPLAGIRVSALGGRFWPTSPSWVLNG